MRAEYFARPILKPILRAYFARSPAMRSYFARAIICWAERCMYSFAVSVVGRARRHGRRQRRGQSGCARRPARAGRSGASLGGALSGGCTLRQVWVRPVFSLGDVYVRGGPADTVYNGDAMCGAAAAGRLLSGRGGGRGHPGTQAPEAAERLVAA
jgi:hypothetical protein